MMKMIIKNINLGKSKFFPSFFFIIFLLKINIGEEYIFKNLILKVLKCKNSEFDDNPEVTSYLQVRDLNNKDNNEVFVFNGWTFSSSPSIQSFDHPVYDLWILKCY